MERKTGSWMKWGVVILVVAAAAYGLFGRRSFRTAALTPPGPVANELREAVSDANVVIVVADATRADHVGCYGYPRETTPHIDRLAESSALFESHFSQTTETKSSTACLLTSQYADTNLADGPRALIPGTFTMEMGLKDAGLRTVLITSNLKASPLYGIGDDFNDAIWDRQLEPMAREGEKRYTPSLAIRAFSEWLDGNADSRFFAYIHLLPPHYPYEQPDEMTALFEGLTPVGFEPGGVPYPETIPAPIPPTPPLPDWINLYDANLRYADASIGEIEQLLIGRGLLDNTLFIVTSDHGEAFGEHGHAWHGRSTYDEVCHIPLLIRFPGEKFAGARIGALTQSVDLLPTIFDLLMARYPAEGIQGGSLLPLLAGTSQSATDYVYCRGGGRPSKYLVRNHDYALMLYSNGKWRALYDLKNDPKQRENIIASHQDVVGTMMGAFEKFAARQRRPPMDFLDPDAVMPPLPEVPEIKMSPEDKARIERIADLGYVR